jgi:hypothetical protein
VIRVGITGRPVLRLGLVLVNIPKLLDQLHDTFGSTNLGKTQFGVIVHALWLTETHVDAFSFVVKASTTAVTIMLNTTINKVLVPRLFVPQILNRHAFVLWRSWVVGRIHTTSRGRGASDVMLANRKSNSNSNSNSNCNTVSKTCTCTCNLLVGQPRIIS